MTDQYIFICLVFFGGGGGGVIGPLDIFHSYGNVTITIEGLQIVTYAWHSWPLNSEGSLACNTYCDAGHPFIMVISEDP